jgi:hypothetical protein
LPHSLSLVQGQRSWFADCFSFYFVCCSLDQELSFVDRYLPYLKQWLITHPLSALLPFWSLFTESSCGDPLLGCAYGTLPPLCSMFFFSSLFIILFFLWGGGQSVQGAMLVYPRGGCGSTTCHLFAHLLVCVSHAGLSQHLAVWESSWFLSVMCHGEVL